MWNPEITRENFIASRFGGIHKIDIWRAILGFGQEPFRTIDLQKSLKLEKGISESVTGKEVREIRRLGMFAVHHMPEDRRADYLTPADHPVWELIAVAVKVVDELYPPAGAEAPPDGEPQ